MSEHLDPLAKPLVILASERTGTNYLCELLSHHPQIAAYYEIFSNVAVMMTDEEVKALCELQKWPFTYRSDPQLVKRFKGNSHQIIKLIGSELSGSKETGKEETGKRKILSFKVFQDHLPHTALAQMIDDYSAIAITRRVIDSYVSFIKATETSAWLKLDTTQVKPTLYIEDFVDWYHQRQTYYKQCADRYLKAHHSKIEVLRYEEFTRGSNSENLAFICQKISAATGIVLDHSSAEFDLKFWKQDKNQSVTEKVANWSEFEEQLQQKGLLEAAFTNFLE
jgi:LPS sulfotransferase NodH